MEPLGQVGKRLQIIKTAISLTDDETINAQRSKLRLQKNDAQLDTILSVLDDENYVQASTLIDRYLRGSTVNSTVDKPENDTPSHTPKVETTPDTTAKPARSAEEAELIKKFGLFMEEASKEEYNPISEDEMFIMAKEAEKKNHRLRRARADASTQKIYCRRDLGRIQ